MSLAHAQFYKNASRSNDRAAVDFNLRLALASARRALLLDFRNAAARVQVAQLEGKLKRLAPAQ
jgi:hypothetical protein